MQPKPSKSKRKKPIFFLPRTAPKGDHLTAVVKEETAEEEDRGDKTILAAYSSILKINLEFIKNIKKIKARYILSFSTSKNE